MAGQMSFYDYDGFVEKFKPKKTTDDCYTPPEIYDVIAGYVCKRYGIDRSVIVRPFWPDGDFENEEYPEGCVVLDNPPFSILSKIVNFYMRENVAFFLFAPTLTCLSQRASIMKTNHIVCSANITYENGASVNTSFVTNLDTDGTVMESGVELSEIINAKNDELQKAPKKQVSKYIYPDAVITAAKVGWFSAHHTPYKLNARDCCPIFTLDAMNGKGIFGGGLLLSKRAAAERAAAKKWQLSERELKIQELLTKQSERGD